LENRSYALLDFEKLTAAAFIAVVGAEPAWIRIEHQQFDDPAQPFYLAPLVLNNHVFRCHILPSTFPKRHDSIPELLLSSSCTKVAALQLHKPGKCIGNDFCETAAQDWLLPHTHTLRK
jgi:hypothetical protein